MDLKEYIGTGKAIIDHMIPYSLNGSNMAYNLWLLCWKCDRIKADRLIPEAVALSKQREEEFLAGQPGLSSMKVS